MLVLYIICWVNWVPKITDTSHASSTTSWICWAIEYLFRVTSDTATWIGVWMVIERFLMIRCLYTPSRCACNISRTKTSVVIITLALIGINAYGSYREVIHAPYTGTGYNKCYITYTMWKSTWSMILDEICQDFPLCLIFLLLVWIRIHWIKPCRNSALTESLSSYHSQETEYQFSKLVAIVLISHLLCNVPNRILILIRKYDSLTKDHYRWSGSVNDYYQQMNYKFAWTVVSWHIPSVNCALLFCWVYATVPSFRKELVTFKKAQTSDEQIELNNIHPTENAETYIDEGVYVQSTEIDISDGLHHTII